MQNIIEPEILYNNSYLTASFSSILSKNVVAFSKFILNNTDSRRVLEVGANSGSLYKLLTKDNLFDYTVVDIFKDDALPTSINFHEGRCELFDYTGHDTVILSHTFEHLIEPRLFIERVRENGVNTIFISIPNFNNLVEMNDIQTINSQHTFYCGYDHIVYMFSLYGYRCSAFDTYINHTSMFKFVIDESMEPTSRPSVDYHIKRIEDNYSYNLEAIKNICLESPSYIYPGGQIGQALYVRLNERNKHIIGFIDGDKRKHGTRLYGTPLLTFPVDKLLEHRVANESDRKVNVIICKSPYENEILTKMQQYKDIVNIILLRDYFNL